MVYPEIFYYSIALQDPSSSLLCPKLKGVTVESNSLGPITWSGSFAVIFHLINKNEEYALRCFLRNVPDIKYRYFFINKMMQENSLDFMVKTRYLEKGIIVCDNVYEVILMDWVKGDTLGCFLNKFYRKNDIIERIIEGFVNIISKLEALGIAHGDLQHGNIIITNNYEIKLVDYDAMFLPKKYCNKELISYEIGHPNYQHPDRKTKNIYNEKIDRFSSICIYLSLKALYEYNKRPIELKYNISHIHYVQNDKVIFNNIETKENYNWTLKLTVLGIIIGLLIEVLIAVNLKFENQIQLILFSIFSFALITMMLSILGFIVDHSLQETKNREKKSKKSDKGNNNYRIESDIKSKHLWEKYYNEDNLLFTNLDIEFPEKSELINELMNIENFSNYIIVFKEICKGSIDNVPTLSEFIKKCQYYPEKKNDLFIKNNNTYNPSL